MSQLIDVVNFNADASCLSSARWLEIMAGGEDSEFCGWLQLYVERRRPMALGIVGSAVADLATFNPEALALIQGHPEIFEIVLRPFAHDVGLLRTRRGFEWNFRLGEAAIRHAFGRALPWFLPPEFMLTGSHVAVLAAADVEGVFLNPARLHAEARRRLPDVAYRIEGVLGSRLTGIPFCGELTDAYLDSLHAFGRFDWTANRPDRGAELLFAWRDGESCFLLPDGVEREAAWLDAERCLRRSLRDVVGSLAVVEPDALPREMTRSYPIPSFSAWVKEFRMLGYLARLDRIETQVDRLSSEQRALWLQAINSDVLSAVEKQSPVVSLSSRTGEAGGEFTIWRSERGGEGEDFLARLESLLEARDSTNSVPCERPHWLKLRARMDFLARFEHLQI